MRNLNAYRFDRKTAVLYIRLGNKTVGCEMLTSHSVEDGNFWPVFLLFGLFLQSLPTFIFTQPLKKMLCNGVRILLEMHNLSEREAITEKVMESCI